MALAEFQVLVKNVTNTIVGENLNVYLAEKLNTNFPPDGDIFRDIKKVCVSAIEEGWMCNQEFGGIRFGRVIKDVDGFSVDVVHMNNVVGPQHRHPKGEIDMVMPVEGNAKFDGCGSGWLVYGPGSTHNPTVTEGKAIVLYLLPDGEIEFIRA